MSARETAHAANTAPATAVGAGVDAEHKLAVTLTAPTRARLAPRSCPQTCPSEVQDVVRSPQRSAATRLTRTPVARDDHVGSR